MACESPERWQRNVMNHAIAPTPAVWLGGGLGVVVPMPESHADVGGVELERVADRDEREGTVHVVGREPGPNLRKHTSPSRTLLARPLMEREESVRENRDLATLLGLNPGASEGTSIELGRQDTVWRELGLQKLHSQTSLISRGLSRTYRAVPVSDEREAFRERGGRSSGTCADLARQRGAERRAKLSSGAAARPSTGSTSPQRISPVDRGSRLLEASPRASAAATVGSAMR
jgi:hypothetical protein